MRKILASLFPLLSMMLTSLLLVGQAPEVGHKVVGINCFENGHYVYYDGQSACPSTSSSSVSDETAFQTMSPALQGAAYNLGYQLGQSLAGFLFGNSQQAAQRAAYLRQLQLQRNAEERRRAIEEARRRQEIFQRLQNSLKLSGLADLSLKGFDNDSGGLHLKGLDDVPLAAAAKASDNPLGLKGLGDEPAKDDNLSPKGTSFFGLGGGSSSNPPPPPPYDPMVVDLRHVQQGVVLAQLASNVPPSDQPVLFDQALNAANGDPSVVVNLPSDATVPVVSEEGLKAFQQANIDYAKTRDSRLQANETFIQAARRREIADAIVQATKADLERATPEKMDEATLAQKRQIMAEVSAAAKVEAETWQKSKAELDAAQTRVDKAREACVQVLRFLAAGKTPSNFSPTLAVAPNKQGPDSIPSARPAPAELQALISSIKDIEVPLPTQFVSAAGGIKADDRAAVSMRDLSTVAEHLQEIARERWNAAKEQVERALVVQPWAPGADERGQIWDVSVGVARDVEGLFNKIAEDLPKTGGLTPEHGRRAEQVQESALRRLTGTDWMPSRR